MSLQFRSFICIIIGLCAGGLAAVFDITPLVFLVLAPLAGFVTWHWLLFGDYARPFGFLRSQHRALVISVVQGNSNLGSATTMRVSILRLIWLAFTMLTLGYQIADLTGLAQPTVPFFHMVICIGVVGAGYVIFTLLRGRIKP